MVTQWAKTKTLATRRWHYTHFMEFVGSRVFFVATLCLFSLQAFWIAISSRFPMAYDEKYHVRLVQFYAHHWSPFLGAQPASADYLGNITRNPSYLFHYLMSFPYRLFHLAVPSFAANVIFLRLIDVVLFGFGIVLFRQVLLKVHLARPLIHVLLFCLILLPIVPFLAATVNYDNLLFPLTALALLLGLRLAEKLKSSGTLDLKIALQLIAVCCLASLVQYSFLPIFVGIVLFFGGYLLRISRGGKPRMLFQVSKVGGVLVIVFALLGAGLFVERYGYNTLRYHTPLPQCDKVLSVNACSAYAPWQRNYQLAQTNVSHHSLRQMARFDRTWVHLLAGGVFAVVAAQGGVVQPAIPYVMVSGLIILAIGTAFALLYWRRWLMHKVPLMLLATVTVCYLGALWLQNYADFSHLGIPIGVQARYLVPVLPLLMIVPGVGFTLAFRERQHLSFAVAAMAMLVLLVGGGAATYVLRSNNDWYWDSAIVVRANDYTRHLLHHLTPV